MDAKPRRKPQVARGTIAAEGEAGGRWDSLEVLENVGDGFIGLDDALRITYLSRRAEQTLGKSREELLGHPLRELFPRPIRDSLLREAHRALVRQTTLQFEEHIPATDTWFEFRVVPARSGVWIHIHDVSEHRKEQQKLRHRLEQHEVLLNNIPDIAWLKDTRSRILDVNEAFSRSCGLSREEIAGKSDFDLFPRSLAEGYRRADRRALREGRRIKLEEALLAADGTVSWLETIKTPFRSRTGAWAGTVGIARDITQRKQAEHDREQLLARIESERGRLSAVIEHIPVGVLLADARSGRIVLRNPPLEEILGRAGPSAQTVADLGGWTAYHQDGRQVEVSEWPLYRALQGEVVHGEEILLEREDGSRGWIHASSAPILDAAGEIIEGVMAFDDIDREKRAEESQRFLAHAGRLLATSLDETEVLRQIERLVVPHLADWCLVAMVEGDGQLRPLESATADPRRSELLRRLQGQGGGELDAGEGPLVRALRHGRAVLLASGWERALRGAARQEVPGDLPSHPLMIVPLVCRGQALGVLLAGVADSGRSLGAPDLGLAEELACRAALAMSNARLYREAQHALTARDEVLRVVAHDLRGPLSTVMMGLQVLGESGGAGPDGATLGILRRSAERMDRLIQDLLDVARLEANRLSLDLQRYEAPHLVGEAIELHDSLAAAKGVALSAELDRGAAPVYADRDRILQVLSNLIGNALKFTPAGGRVVVSVRANATEIRFCVADTGPGIPAEHLGELFRPFWQALPGLREGAGLGLAIAKGIVAAHGGRIGVESTVGAGTSVWFTLPVAEELRDTGGQRPEAAPEPEVRLAR